jgi:hypothetical protein
MSSEEVKPPIDGTVELSQAAPTTPVRKGTLSTEERDALRSKLGMDPATSSRKREPLPIPIENMSPEQFRAYNLAKTAKSRAKQAEKQKKADYIFDSKTLPKESEIMEILEGRGIKTGHIARTVYNLAATAAEMLGLTPNRFYFQNGVEQTLASYAAKQAQPLQEIEDKWYPGERIRVRDLHAIWDFSMSWREQEDGRLISFQEFRQLRRMCMTDTFEFGRQILKKDFQPEPHGRWAKELFVVKNPDLLPEVYDQEDIKRTLAGLSPIHQRILISSRNSYKSTYSLVDLLSWVLVFGGDLRIFMISATTKLSKGFLKAFRDYWTVKNPKSPTLFNQLFPEFMIEPGEGQITSFISPCRQLDLIQPTLTSASMGSEGLAGERSDLIVAEDCAEISNSNSPEMREKTMEFFDSVLHLLEPNGFLQVVGTPFAPGDIYSTLFEREEKREEKLLLSQINPCWTVRPGVKKLPYDTNLTAADVDLLFPSRLTFKWLMEKLRDGSKEFRQQYLCSWVPDADDELKILFTEADLQLRTKPASYFDGWPTTEIILYVDPSFSTSAVADYSCLATIRMAHHDGKPVGIVTNCLLERLRISELSVKIIETISRQHPNRVIIERAGAWESLFDAIKKGAFLRNMSLPYIFWKTTTQGNVINAKAKRIKSLEPKLADGELWFLKADFNESVFFQFTKFDGSIFKRANASRKLDAPDAIALGFEYAFPRSIYEVENNEEQRIANEAAVKHERLRQWNKHIFGVTAGVPPSRPQPADNEEEPNINPLFRGIGSHIRRT